MKEVVLIFENKDKTSVQVTSLVHKETGKVTVLGTTPISTPLPTNKEEITSVT